MIRAAATIFSVILAMSGVARAQPAPSPVSIDSGQLQGVSANGVVAFKGIPYAAPPVGSLRWRAPQPAPSWTGVRAADAYGKSCIQPASMDTGAPAALDMSEDCLTINVLRPADDRKVLPVLVWIHGGALVTGSSSLPVYDGDNFARRGLVFVSFNYRLGRFGFFAHPSLTKENADGGRLGNYGLMDQIAALEWVKRNIAAFGGDPAKVTVFGESAGAYSIEALMLSPPARGLFQAAIVESGYGRGSYPRIDKEAPDSKYSEEQEGNAFVTSLGVEKPDPTPEELRSIPADAIRDKFRYSFRFGAILDGVTLKEDLWDGFRHGDEAPVALIIGSNSQENPPVTDKDMAGKLLPYLQKKEWPALAPLFGGQKAFQDFIATDEHFTEQARAIAAFHARNGHPTYLYRFSVLAESLADKQQGARHAAEIAYVFDNLAVAATPPFGTATGARDEAAAKAMNEYWVNFAAKGDPNGGALPAWPRYQPGKEPIMDFTDAGPKPGKDPRAKRLDALSKLLDPRS